MTAAKGTKPDPRPRPRLQTVGDRFVVVYPVFRYRILLTTGEVVDVDGIRDDSELRGLIVGDGPNGANAIPGSEGAAIAGMTMVQHVGWTDDPEGF